MELRGVCGVWCSCNGASAFVQSALGCDAGVKFDTKPMELGSTPGHNVACALRKAPESCCYRTVRASIANGYAPASFI
jgi:hypothetical protein